MYFLGIGIVLLAMWYLEIGPVGAWPWYVIAIPWALAVLWWWWADATGYTKRKAMEREDARRQARIDKNKEAIGTMRKPRR